MKRKEAEITQKPVLTHGEYVEALREGIEFHPEAVVDTLYGAMSPGEITRRTIPQRKTQLTQGSWSG